MTANPHVMLDTVAPPDDPAAVIAAWRLILMLRPPVAAEGRPMITARLALATDLATAGQYPEAESVLVDAWHAETTAKYCRYERQRGILEKLGQLYAAWAAIDPARKHKFSTWQKMLAEFEAGPRGQCA